MQEKPGLEDTLVLMKDLRRRCEWDAAQTHESLRPYLIEEAYEVDDAIRSGNDTLLREELGDLLLQVLFHSVVAEERGAFDFGDVAEGFLAKMKSRHPHLYEGGERQSWEGMKAKKRDSVVDGLPADLPVTAPCVPTAGSRRGRRLRLAGCARRGGEGGGGAGRGARGACTRRRTLAATACRTSGSRRSWATCCSRW